MSTNTRLSCPVNRAVAALADKWKIVLILALARRTWRFGELLTAIDGIAPKVLVRQLRSLEEDGLVARKAYAEVPPRVEYRLTETGLSLLPILIDLQKWVVANSASLSPTITGSDPASYNDAHLEDPEELLNAARRTRSRP